MRKTITHQHRLVAHFLGAASLLLASACSTFQGPGGLTPSGSPSQSAGAITPPNVRSPALAMNGERGFTQAQEAMHFQWPVDEASMSRGFLAAPVKRKRPHWGVDLANHKNTPILASEKGTVVYTGHAFKGYGKLVVVEHSDEWATLYAHLNNILVSEGQVVNQGEKIGEMGRTGHATGVHLHFEIRHFRQPVNPLAYLPPTTVQPRTFGQLRTSSIRLSPQASQEEQQSDQ
jgi:murein DD-endopeptidase MepM/ murein hydrolase activator NlpD